MLLIHSIKMILIALKLKYNNLIGFFWKIYKIFPVFLIPKY